MEINNEVGSISQGDNELIMSSDFESCEKDDVSRNDSDLRKNKSKKKR